MHPDGPMTISEFARRLGRPRATIHRHLKDANISEDMILEYARVLAPRGREQEVILELRVAAGYPISLGDKEDEIRAIAQELARLDRPALDAVWQLLSVLSRRNVLSSAIDMERNRVSRAATD